MVNPYGCGVVIDANIRRKGCVVHCCCPSNETRPLLWGPGLRLSCVMGGGRHSEDIAVVILWHVRQKLYLVTSVQSRKCGRVQPMNVLSIM